MGDQMAPTFASMPGLISKVWLADTASNTYGGIYTWTDRAAMENYIKGDIFKSVLSSPNLVNASSRDFDVLAGPTQVDRGLR